MPVSINGTTGIIDANITGTAQVNTITSTGDITTTTGNLISQVGRTQTQGIATSTTTNVLSAVRSTFGGGAPFRINHTDGAGRVNISWNVDGATTQTGTFVGGDVANRFIIGGNSGFTFLNSSTLGTAGSPITWVTCLVITSAGNVGIGATPTAHQLQLTTDSAGKPGTNTWTIVSDERLKTDISLANTDRCYEIIKQLPLKRYTWKDEIYSQEQVSDRSKLGWVAQDVQTVFPKGVNETVMTFCSSGLSADEITINDCLSLNADQIYAAMYGAIQKLINITETQSAMISSLETRIATLEAS